MLPLILGLAMAGGGAASNYFGAMSEADRKKRAINQAKQQFADISNRRIGVQSQAGQIEQNALLAHLMQQAGGQDVGQATQNQADQAAQVAQLTGPQTAGPADAVGAAAAGRVNAQAGVRRRAENALALLRGIQEVQRQSAGRMGTTVAGSRVSLAEALTRQQMEADRVQAELDSVMGTTGNAAANMQLLGGLLNAGAGASMSFAGRA